MEEDLSDSLEVVVLWLADNWGEGLDGDWCSLVKVTRVTLIRV